MTVANALIIMNIKIYCSFKKALLRNYTIVLLEIKCYTMYFLYSLICTLKIRLIEYSHVSASEISKVKQTIYINTLFIYLVYLQLVTCNYYGYVINVKQIG